MTFADVLLAATVATSPCYDDPAGTLRALLNSPAFQAYAEDVYGASFKEGTRLLTWDHLYDQPSAYIWRGGQLVKIENEAGHLQVGAGDPVVMFVTRSNPFLFRATASVVTRTDTEEVANLKKFAALAGVFVHSMSKGRVLSGAETNLLELEKVAADIERLYGAALEHMQMLELRHPFVSRLPPAQNFMDVAGRLTTAAHAVRADANPGTEVVEALKRVPGAMKTAGWLHTFGRTLEGYQDARCRAIDAPVLVHAGRLMAEPSKKLVGGFKLVTTVDPDLVHTERPAPFVREVSVSAASRWGFGAGLAFMPEREESEVALFANLRRAQWTRGNVSAGLQLGFGTSEEPSIYIGPSFDLGPMVRLGGGYGWNSNASGLYLSLSLSLEGISIFE